MTAVCDGLAYRPSVPKRIAVAVAFGAAQGLMPVFGALLGERLLGFLNAEHYIAFAALLIVGVLMLIGGFEKNGKTVSNKFGFKTIIFQAIATSIDAMACGLTLSVMPFPLYADGLTIGVITSLLCAIGIFFATSIGKRINHPERFKLIGGFVLIALALKDLVYCFI